MLARAAVLATVALALNACCLDTGGPGTTGGLSTTGGSGTSGELCPTTKPVFHRPVAVACDGGNTQPPGGRDECVRDSDCPASYPDTRVCSCAPATSRTRAPIDSCLPGDCSIDSDCACGYCSPTYDLTCGSFFGFVGYDCHSEADTCTNDGECDGGYCAYNPEVTHWVCGFGHCAG